MEMVKLIQKYYTFIIEIAIFKPHYFYFFSQSYSKFSEEQVKNSLVKIKSE